MAILIKNSTYIDWQSLEFTEGDILVEEGVGGGITLNPDLAGCDGEITRTLDGTNRFVTKSFGCGHHHIYSTLARGMPAPKKIPNNFVEILQYVWWHLDKNLDIEMIRASALASALYCAKNGVTFVIDHHASPFAVKGSLFTIQEAFDSIGISHLLCYETSDRDGQEIAEHGLAETENYLAAGHQGHVGLHASFTVGDPLLKKAVALARRYNTGLHVHVAEDQADQDHCIQTYGKRVLQRFHEAGALDLHGSIFGHCLFLDDDELKLLKSSGDWVAQNLESNQNNNVGSGDYSRYGSRIMLGTDGMHSDMLRSAKATFFGSQAGEGISYPGIYERFRNVHNYIEQCGYRGDSPNNLVILDYNSPTPLTRDNFLGHFVFGLESAHVETVISSGKVIVDNRKLVSGSEEDILASAREMAVRLWQKLA